MAPPFWAEGESVSALGGGGGALYGGKKRRLWRPWGPLGAPRGHSRCVGHRCKLSARRLPLEFPEWDGAGGTDVAGGAVDGEAHGANVSRPCQADVFWLVVLVTLAIPTPQ